MRRLVLLVIGLLIAVAPSRSALAQDEESSPSIDLGSSRIGGPGLTAKERKWVKSWDQDDEVKTEANIPPPGNKKRLPHLHYLAKNYVNGKAWKEACEKYDVIGEEGGPEAIEAAPYGKQNAARAYLACGKIAFSATEFDKAEKFLSQSERFGPTTPRHTAIRLKMKREAYRKKMVNDDVDGALKLFADVQKDDPNEDERIWMGEQLATKAWAAYNAGDKLGTESLMRRLESVAPMNTEYRRLKTKIDDQQSVLGRLIQVCLAAVGLVVIWNLIAGWRARSRLKLSRNPFDDEDL